MVNKRRQKTLTSPPATTLTSQTCHSTAAASAVSTASGSAGAMWPAAGGDALPMKSSSYHDEQDSINQLAEIALRADSMEGTSSLLSQIDH